MESEKCAYCLLIDELEKDHIAVQESQHFEERECVRRELDGHERHKCDHLVHIYQDPE